MEYLTLASNTIYKILPSLLSADVTNLQSEVAAVIDAGADMLHLDVMDNHYVPNLTFGPLVCEALHKKFPNLPIDVHLMVSPTDELIQKFAKSGATRISIHPDATIHLDRSLQLIKNLGCMAGVVLNPSTSPEILTWCIQRLDFVLIMTVNPGFSGQSLIPEVITKIEFIHKKYPKLPITVDGGVSTQNINSLAKAGVQAFVAGSAIFDSNNYKKTIDTMRQKLKNL